MSTQNMLFDELTECRRREPRADGVILTERPLFSRDQTVDVSRERKYIALYVRTQGDVVAFRAFNEDAKKLAAVFDVVVANNEALVCSPAGDNSVIAKLVREGFEVSTYSTTYHDVGTVFWLDRNPRRRDIGKTGGWGRVTVLGVCSHYRGELLYRVRDNADGDEYPVSFKSLKAQPPAHLRERFPSICD